jgi:hypothetical protein
MVQAAEIVGFATHIDVTSRDGYVAADRIQNNSLLPGVYYRAGFILGQYKADEGVFYCLAFSSGGTVYLVGSLVDALMCKVGANNGYGMATYAPDVAEVLAEDAFAFVLPTPLTLRVFKVDWGGVIPIDPDQGNWILGINADDFMRNQSELLGSRIFTNVITISPKP